MFEQCLRQNSPSGWMPRDGAEVRTAFPREAEPSLCSLDETPRACWAPHLPPPHPGLCNLFIGVTIRKPYLFPRPSYPLEGGGGGRQVSRLGKCFVQSTWELDHRPSFPKEPAGPGASPSPLLSSAPTGLPPPQAVCLMFTCLTSIRACSH